MIKALNKSIGRGKTIVELCSAAMLLSVWRYLNWRAAGEPEMTSAACFKAVLAFCSPSAAIICK